MQISLKSKLLLKLTLFYIYIPICIFLIGWIRLSVAIVVLACTLFGLYRMLRDFQKGLEEAVPINISAVVFAICTVIIIFYCFWMGFSGDVPQAGDWAKHNAILRDLMTFRWPVYYSNAGEHSMLTYYIAQYLIPATLGKLFQSFRLAEIVQFIWCVFGVVLVFMNLLRVVKADNNKKQIMALFIFLFFAGLLIVAQSFAKYLYGDRTESSFGYYHWLTVEDIILQYRSTEVQLRWVFPQSIVAWLTTLLLYEYKDNIQHYVALLLPAMLFGSLSFIGLLPLGMGYAICSFYSFCKTKQIAIILKKIFSLSNCLTALSLGTVLFFYFYGNVFSQKPEDVGFRRVYYGEYKMIYFLFCFCMFGLYSLLVWHKKWKDKFFLLANMTLLVLPFFRMGRYNDWLMCISIPPLFIILIATLSYIIEDTTDYRNARNKGILIACLCISSLYPIYEIGDVIRENQIGVREEFDFFVSMQNCANRNSDQVADDVKYNYYSYDIEKNLFVKYLARQ